MQDASSEQGTLELIIDQLEELAITLIEEIRERPGVAAAILAGLIGAIVGGVLASRARRNSRPRVRAVRKARQFADAADLASIGMKLLENPIVRSYARAAVLSQIKKYTHI